MIRGRFEDLDAPVEYVSTRPYSSPNWDGRPPGDWAGVEGIWKRVISFMDYRDLVIYNVGFIRLESSLLNHQREIVCSFPHYTVMMVL